MNKPTFGVKTPRSDYYVTSPYIIQQTGDESTQTYQEEVVILI